MIRRYQTWYVRVKVPSDLRCVLGLHICRTLKTSDRMTAQTRAVGVVSSLSGLFVDIRKQLAQKVFDVKEGTAEVSELKAFISQNADKIDAIPQEDLHNIKMMLNLLISQEARDNSERKRNLELAKLSAWSIREAHQNGIIEGMSKAIGLAGPSVSQSTQEPVRAEKQAESSVLWFDLVPSFFKDNPGISDKTRESYNITFKQVCDLIMNKPINQVTKQDIKAYADWLRDKPSLRGGNLSHATIVRHVGEIKYFLKWCVSSALIEDKGFSDIQARSKTVEEKRTRQQDRRRGFTNDELKTIFDSPVFTGYKSERQRSTKGNTHNKTYDYWFIVILAFSGARLNEICEAPAKLYDLNGIPCFDLRQSGTKTLNSPRLIPVHPDLKKLGFFEYAKQQEMNGLKLVEDKAKPITAESWSKRLNRYLDDIGLIDDALVAYSFRHTFRQILRVSGLNMEIINKIFGHETGEVGQNYGSNLSYEEAKLFTEKVRFPIFLDHLYDYKTSSRSVCLPS